MPTSQNPNQQQLQIKADDATLKGVYANAMQVQHSKEEFVIDFMNLFQPAGTLNARVIVSPGHAKRMIAALTENMARYEGSFGQVEPAKEQDTGIGFHI
jgi:hypothetical protein